MGELLFAQWRSGYRCRGGRQESDDAAGHAGGSALDKDQATRQTTLYDATLSPLWLRRGGEACPVCESIERWRQRRWRQRWFGCARRQSRPRYWRVRIIIW